jgi:hypothetical protein
MHVEKFLYDTLSAPHCSNVECRKTFRSGLSDAGSTSIQQIVYHCHVALVYGHMKRAPAKDVWCIDACSVVFVEESHQVWVVVEDCFAQWSGTGTVLNLCGRSRLKEDPRHLGVPTEGGC